MSDKKKYVVSVPFVVWVNVYDVEAESAEEAARIGEEQAHLTNYSGNGMASGKLIGVSGRDPMYIETSGEVTDPCEIYVEEHT